MRNQSLTKEKGEGKNIFLPSKKKQKQGIQVIPLFFKECKHKVG